VRLINRLGRNGLGRFAELVLCGSPSEVAGDYIVLGFDRCLLIADQPAGDERADYGVNDRKDSKKGNNFEGGSGQHGVRSCVFVQCTKDAAGRLACQILHAVFCIPEQ
jgi:hypothetical protein